MMAKRWRRELHMSVVTLLIGMLAVDTAAACKLFGRRSGFCPSPVVAGPCGGDKSLPHRVDDQPAVETSPSDSAPPPMSVPAPPAVEPPAVPPSPATPLDAPSAAPLDAPPAAPPEPNVEPIPATPPPARPAVPATPDAPPPAPDAAPPATTAPAATPPAAESFDDLFPPPTPADAAVPEATTPAPPAAPAPAPAPAPSPDEDDPFAPASPATPASPAPAPAGDADDPFAPAPAGNRTDRPVTPASPAPTTDPFANPFQTSAAGAFPVREWSDDSGHFQVRGRLLAILDGKVRILKTTGRTTTVPLSRLSTADQEYVAGVARPAEQAVPQVAAR